MSEATARAARRAARRLAGDQAITIIELHSDALTRHASTLRQQRQSIDSLTEQHRQLTDRVRRLEQPPPSRLERWRATVATWLRYATTGRRGHPLEQRTGDESL